MVTIEKVIQLKRQILMAALMLTATFLFSSMSFAGTIVQGCGDNKSITLTSSTNWTTLCSQKVTLATTQNCVLTGSAKVHNNVVDLHNEYRFTADKDINPITGKKAERLLDVTQGSAADPIDLSVAPVNEMKNLAPGDYTFRLLAEKADSAADDINITAYTLGVVCGDPQ